MSAASGQRSEVRSQRSEVNAPGAGFTLLEVLISLLLVVILITTVFHALMSSLRAEQTSRSRQEAPGLMQRLACAAYLGQSPTNLMIEVATRWQLHREPTTVKEENEETTWDTWTLEPMDNPSARLRFSLQTGEGNRTSP